MKTKVIFKKLLSSHQNESFTNYLPLNNALVSDIGKAVTAIFDELGGASLLKSSGEVFIKPNAVMQSIQSPELSSSEIILYGRKPVRRKYIFSKTRRRQTIPGWYIPPQDMQGFAVKRAQSRSISMKRKAGLCPLPVAGLSESKTPTATI